MATVTPPVVTFTIGPVIELSGDGFAFHIGGTTVFTGPWTLTAEDATLLNVMISPDFPQIGWTGRIEAEATPTLTFANVSECQFIGTGLAYDARKVWPRGHQAWHLPQPDQSLEQRGGPGSDSRE